MAKPSARPSPGVMASLDLVATSTRWLDAVLGDFDSFLRDHASCEKKASGMALSVASHYPDRPELLNAMVDLAVEELGHYREVIRLLTERGLTPGSDEKDPYVRDLQSHIRKGSDFYLLDRLLVAAVVERRGYERFGLIAAALPEGSLKQFYKGITASEKRHWQLFVNLATTHCEPGLIAPRLLELAAVEGKLIANVPLRAALH